MVHGVWVHQLGSGCFAPHLSGSCTVAVEVVRAVDVTFPRGRRCSATPEVGAWSGVGLDQPQGAHDPRVPGEHHRSIRRGFDLTLCLSGAADSHSASMWDCSRTWRSRVPSLRALTASFRAAMQQLRKVMSVTKHHRACSATSDRPRLLCSTRLRFPA